MARFRFILKFGNGFQAAAYVHLVANAFDVRAHGFDSDVQLITDLLVDKPRREQFKDLALARRQIFSVSRCGRTAIKRHGRGTQLVFFDGSARRIRVPDLWRLKWHKEYPVDYAYPNAFFPAWTQ